MRLATRSLCLFHTGSIVEWAEGCNPLSRLQHIVSFVQDRDTSVVGGWPTGTDDRFGVMEPLGYSASQIHIHQV